ncbi:MAG: hypothetical protein ACRDRP_16615 [Pseudonocardiaceae bacterium]
MTFWFVAAVPPLIMLFALAMERLENRLRRMAVHDTEIEELLQVTRANEMRALLGNGVALGRDGLGRSRRTRQRS